MSSTKGKFSSPERPNKGPQAVVRGETQRKESYEEIKNMRR